MLRVRLEILPGADARRYREIGRLEICNVYDFADSSDYGWQMFHEGKPYKSGVHSARWRKAGPWRLLRMILVGMNLREFPSAEKTAPQAEE